MDALAALRLQFEWGADEALDEAPSDRLIAPSRQRPASTPVRDPDEIAPPASPPGPVLLSATPVERARALAAAAQTMEALHHALAGFDGCALRDTAANLVFGDPGTPGAPLMLVGDVPGAEEDRTGQAFAGAAGDLLARMLSSIGLDRAGLPVAMLIPWRPPGGRPPAEAEIALCLPFLLRRIALAVPPRLLVLGPVASRALAAADPAAKPATRRRGPPAWTSLALPGRDHPLPVLTIDAPSVIARSAAARRSAWAALRLLARSVSQEIEERGTA